MNTYEMLKDVYKIEVKDKSLFEYLLANSEVNDSVIFHKRTKSELIEQYLEITKKHLEILVNL